MLYVQTICQEKGFAIAATQGTSCYCENTLPLPRLYEAGDKQAAGNGEPCSTVCPGVYIIAASAEGTNTVHAWWEASFDCILRW